jgi:hypothetical protein
VSATAAELTRGDQAAIAPDKRFPVFSIAELAALSPPAWLIQGVLPLAEIGMMYGPSGCGKSFLALDMACALVRGKAWHGLPARKTRVTWVAAEAAGSVLVRADAYCSREQVSRADLDIRIIPSAPNLADKADTDALITRLQLVGAELVVIDTLAAASNGCDENSAADMNRVMSNCRRIYAQAGCMVLLIHHSGKDSAKGARGWSGIRAAVDAELAVTKGTVKVTKLRDGATGATYPFRLTAVKTPAGESCVVEYCASPPPKRPHKKTDSSDRRRRRPPGRVQALLLESQASHAAAGRSVTVEALISEVTNKCGPRGRDKTQRALKSLVEGGALHETAGGITAGRG